MSNVINGKDLAEIRYKHDRTQSQVSKAIGLSRPTYNAIELGKRTINMEELDKLARIMARNSMPISWSKMTKGEKNAQVQFVKYQTSFREIYALIEADRAATLSRLLEKKPTIADFFPTDPGKNPDSYQDMLKVIAWYEALLKTELDILLNKKGESHVS